MTTIPTTQVPTIVAPAITRKQLCDMFAKRRGATFITILARTEPNMRKTANPFYGKVYKISRVNGIAWFIYSNSVNNQREREGRRTDFEAEPRKWGIRLEGTSLVEHKGNTYLELKVERSLGHTYVWNDGTPLTDEEVIDLKTYLFESYRPKTQETDKEIILRDYNINNIITVAIDGNVSVVVPL